MYKKIDVTQGNINNGHCYVPTDYNFIDKKFWGGKNSAESGDTLTLKFFGTGEDKLTDVDGTKRIFRKTRGEMRRFFEHHKISDPTSIFIQKIDDNTFLITQNEPIGS